MKSNHKRPAGGTGRDIKTEKGVLMMAETETKKKKSFFSIFHIRHLPMDFGRLICAPLQLVYRFRRLNR